MKRDDALAFDAFAKNAAQMMRDAFTQRLGFRAKLSEHGDGLAELLDTDGNASATATVRGTQLALPFGGAPAAHPPAPTPAAERKRRQRERDREKVSTEQPVPDEPAFYLLSYRCPDAHDVALDAWARGLAYYVVPPNETRGFILVWHGEGADSELHAVAVVRREFLARVTERAKGRGVELRVRPDVKHPSGPRLGDSALVLGSIIVRPEGEPKREVFYFDAEKVILVDEGADDTITVNPLTIAATSDGSGRFRQLEAPPKRAKKPRRVKRSLPVVSGDDTDGAS